MKQIKLRIPDYRYAFCVAEAPQFRRTGTLFYLW